MSFSPAAWRDLRVNFNIATRRRQQRRLLYHGLHFVGIFVAERVAVNPASEATLLCAHHWWALKSDEGHFSPQSSIRTERGRWPWARFTANPLCAPHLVDALVQRTESPKGLDDKRNYKTSKGPIRSSPLPVTLFSPLSLPSCILASSRNIHGGIK